MNGEIKFRAWDKEEKRMEYFCPFTKEFRIDESLQLFAERAVLMRFTNLHDKNGKEIYEGDIVSLGRNVNQRRCIGWFEDKTAFGYVYPTGEQFQSFSYDRQGFNKDRKKWEVIGNIYENPELLN